MKTSSNVVSIALALIVLLLAALPAAAGDKGSGYQTGLIRYDGLGGFTTVGPAIGADPYAPGAYYGINYYNGGNFTVQDFTSPEATTAFGFTEAIASWNATTPPGTWVEVQLRTRLAGRWTKWYSMGIWASYTSDATAVKRHSVKLQGDADGYVSTDTLVLTAKKAAADGVQIKVRLFTDNSATMPTVEHLAVAYSTAAPKKAGTVSAGDSARWNTLLVVPECSQMVYPDGGNVWCSPTSTSMVLGYWGIDAGPCEPRVRAAVAGVYDWVYDGHGNWPFNTAYAASRGLEAYVVRFTSLDQVESWVEAGVPVIVSFAWGKGDLTGAAIPSSSGHLAVIVGFDGSGNPIVNDPAAASDDDVQRAYLRAEFEPLWLTNSGGTVYLIYPNGTTVPGL
jgi:hypothetical protein